MGYGCICCRIVYSVLLGYGNDYEPSITFNKLNDDDDDSITIATASGQVRLPTDLSVDTFPTELSVGEFGHDSLDGYYLICGRLHKGGGIWDDGGSISLEELAEDRDHFDRVLRPEFDEFKAKLGLPETLVPEFKMFISFGQSKY